MSSQAPSFRTHQRQLLAVVHAMAEGADVADILAAVAPGAGKSLLPPIAASVLLRAGIASRVIWACPRDSLKEQAAEAFTDPYWRTVLDHELSVRAAENAPNPSRGLAGYVTTYQAIAAAPDLHLAEVRKHPTILVLDEAHHLPALSEQASESDQDDQEQSWSAAVLPLLECARIRLLLSGTIERADGRKILWLPYRRGQKAGQAEVDLDAPGWAVIGYSRAQALAERAVLPVVFAAYDGQARWLEPASRQPDGSSIRSEAGPHRLYSSHPTETTRPAIFTALRTGFADAVLRRAFEETRDLRARRRALGIDPLGLGKLLVVAPDQAQARRYLAALRSWIPQGKQHIARICVSDERDAHETLAYFRLTAEPSILVSVAMASEGFDAKSVAVIAALTHIRSRPWLEQMIARATRIDPHAGPYESQRALVLHPDDPFFGIVRRRMEQEQGTVAKTLKPRRQAALPLWLQEQLEQDREDRQIVPLESNALTLRMMSLAPGPDLAMKRPEVREAQGCLLETPSVIERRLRVRVGQMVSTQVVEDADGMDRPRHNYHAYNATLKRILGKGRAVMTLSELESAVAWLERNRLSDHLHLLDGDPRYDWTRRQRRTVSEHVRQV